MPMNKSDSKTDLKRFLNRIRVDSNVGFLNVSDIFNYLEVYRGQLFSAPCQILIDHIIFA